MGCDSQFDEPTKNDLKLGKLVKEQGPRIQTTRFAPAGINKEWEYNDRTDSYQEVPMENCIGTAKQTIEIIGFGDPVAQPGIYLGSDDHIKEPGWGEGTTVCKDKPEYAPLENRVPLSAFEQELRRLINAHSMENASNTPDNILAEYLAGCLAAFNIAMQQREQWYGRRTF